MSDLVNYFNIKIRRDVQYFGSALEMILGHYSLFLVYFS